MSKLIKELDLTEEELKKYTTRCNRKLYCALKRVLHGHSYRKAGEPSRISKQVLYYHLKRIYREKFGVDYAQ